MLGKPVVTQGAEGKQDSAKHDVWKDAKRAAREQNLCAEKQAELCELRTKQWLINRAERCGFQVSEEHLKHLVVDSYQQHRLYKKRGSRPVTFSSLEYTGILTVKDPARFQATLFKGIGRSRSFGCGLILVRRV